MFTLSGKQQELGRYLNSLSLHISFLWKHPHNTPLTHSFFTYTLIQIGKNIMSK